MVLKNFSWTWESEENIKTPMLLQVRTSDIAQHKQPNAGKFYGNS